MARNEMYILVTGTKHYHGVRALSDRSVFRCVKEPDNSFDPYAIRVEDAELGTVGYVAERLAETFPRVLTAKRFGHCFARVCYVEYIENAGKMLICRYIPEAEKELGEIYYENAVDNLREQYHRVKVEPLSFKEEFQSLKHYLEENFNSPDFGFLKLREKDRELEAIRRRHKEEKIVAKIAACIEALPSVDLDQMAYSKAVEPKEEKRAQATEHPSTFAYISNIQGAEGLDSLATSHPAKEAGKGAGSTPKPRTLEDLINHLDATFSERLLWLIDRTGKTDVQIYTKAQIDRKHFSKIRTNRYYNPTKKTVLAFAFALELSLDETLDLLATAGFTLSKSSKFDVVITYFLDNKKYDIYRVNECLTAFELPDLI